MSRPFRPLAVLSLILIVAPHLLTQPATPANAEAETPGSPRVRRGAEEGRCRDSPQVLGRRIHVRQPAGRTADPHERIKNLKTGLTALSSIAHDTKEEQIRICGDMAVYTALLTVAGQYSGQAAKGQDRVLVIWIRRDGRWQRLATQMTTVAGR